MTEDRPMDDREPTEEEMRAAIEEQMRRVSVDDIVVQTVISLLNVGGYRLGLAPGTEPDRDLGQVEQAIEGARALFPLVEATGARELPTIRDTLTRMQLAYAQLRDASSPAPGAGEPAPPPPEPPAAPEGPGPAQSSGRLWVPGQ